jgi:hypothetical protein
MIYWILGLYILPMIINLLFVYSDEQVTTVEDLMHDWWVYFVPILNLLVTIAIPIHYLTMYCKREFWDKIKNIKIK